MPENRRNRILVLSAVLVLLMSGAVGTSIGTKTALSGGGSVMKTSQLGTFPPGFNDTGVVDPVRLASAHAALLGNDSYTVEATRTERFSNGTLRTLVETTGGHDAGDGFRYTTTVEETADRYYAGPAGTWEVWSNGTVTVGAFTNENGTDYQLRGPTNPSLDRQEDLLVLFGALETAVANRSTSNGTTRFRLEATGVRYPADLASAYGVDSVRNVSLSAVVTSEGLVREYRVAFDASRGNATTRVVETIGFSAVGSTTVRQPDWVSEALNRPDEE